MRRFLFTVLLASAFIAVKANTKEKVILINPSVKGRIYEGMGALSAGASSRLLIDYPEPYRSQILDYLFKPKFGASLNHFKTEIGGDVNSTCGTEPSHQHYRDDENYERGYEFWLMKEARKRNDKVVLDVLPWGAPAWIGDGKYYSEDMPEYVAKFLQGAKKVHDLDIDYVGIWNERPYNVDYIKNLRRTLDKYGLKTKIAAADEIRSYWIAQDIMKDPELYDAVDVIGTHYPFGQGGELYNGKTVYENYSKDYRIVWNEAVVCGKPIWSLEDGPWCGNWNGAKGIIKILVRNYIDAKMVKTITWSLISSYHDNIGIPQSGLMVANTPWSGHYEVQPALWAMAHFTQFVEPGWSYLEAGANGYTDNGASYATLLSPDGDDLSMIIEAVATKSDEKIKIYLPEEFASKDFYVWKSDSLEQFVCEPNTIKSNSEGYLSLDVKKGTMYSVTTTVGQRKGDRTLHIPAPKNFPIPFKDNYESYSPEKLPKYTSDISGCFEVAEVDGNKVLKQVVVNKGIEWAASLNTEPFTVIGDNTMVDYKIAVDVKLEKITDVAYVMGRIPYVCQGQVVPPMGYWLRVEATGNYELKSTMPAEKTGWADFRGKWNESNQYFSDDTKNSKIFTYSELISWPKERLDLFEGLDLKNNFEDKVLIIYSSGSYAIYELRTLAKGNADYKKEKWNNIALSFRGDNINCYLDGRKICSVTDSVYKQGYGAIGTGWNIAMFDNLNITTK